jgi:hypothetical protein
MDSSFSFFRYNVFHSVVYNRTTTAAEEAAEEKRESREAGGTAGKEKKPSKESLARQGLSPVHEALFPTYASPAAKGRESEDSSDFKNEDIGDSWTTVCPLLFALYCLPSTVCLSQLSACLNCLPCSLNCLPSTVCPVQVRTNTSRVQAASTRLLRWAPCARRQKKTRSCQVSGARGPETESLFVSLFSIFSLCLQPCD